MKAEIVLAGISAFTFAFDVSASDYVLKQNATVNDAVFTAPSSFWESIDGGIAANEITSSDNCYVMNGRSITSSEKTPSFPGNALHLGKGDGSQSGSLVMKGDFTCLNLRWHNGDIYNGSGGQNFVLYGAISLDCPTKTHRLRFLSASPSSQNSWSEHIAANLISTDADVVLDVLLNSGASQDCYSTGSGLPIDAQIALSGDNSGFNGKIKVSNFGHLALAHVNAAGSPSDARADAIELAANSRLAVANSVKPNASRGIAITGAGAQIHARVYGSGMTDCNVFELPMPITGEYGFTKMGDGTVTLSGAYSAGDIVVANGTLVLDAAGSFPSGLKVTVHDGATLIQNKVIPAIDVDCREGGTYTKGYSYVVPYNPDTGVTTPLDFTGGMPGDDILPIALSAAIKLPCHITNRIDMAFLPVGTIATAASFSDLTPKTYGLPKTSFEIEDRGSVKVLVLVAKPVVVNVKGFVYNADTDPGLGSTGDHWSDGEIARPGVDYLVTNRVDGLKSEFFGDSITFAGNSGTEIVLRDDVSHIGKATFFPGPFLVCPNRGLDQLCFAPTDSIHIPKDGAGNSLYFESRWATGSQKEMRLNLNIPLSGDGMVVFRGRDANARNIIVSGDNSQMTGVIRCTTAGTPSLTDHSLIHVSTANALGGAPESFLFNAIELTGYAHIVADASVTLETPNRGIYVTEGGLNVSNGVTLTVKQPLRVNGTFSKEGGGTLALGGPVSFGANGKTSGSQNRFLVREGSVKALSDAAVAGFATTFSDGTKILLDASAEMTNGFTGSITFEEGASVMVEAQGLVDGTRVILPICTVPDSSLNFTPISILGLKCAIVKSDVVLGGTACVRYSAKFGPSGFILVVR